MLPIVLPTATEIAEVEQQLDADAEEVIAAARAPATLVAYSKQWRYFREWCARMGASAELPVAPLTVARYLAWLVKRSGRSLSYVQQAAAAIADRHAADGFAPPTAHPQVRQLMQGGRRRLGVAPRRQARPLRPEDLRERVVPILRPGLRGARALTALSFGLASALRRREFCDLLADQLERVEPGYVVHLLRAKNDPHGIGHKRLVALGDHPDVCPVLAMDAWISAAGVGPGTPVLRSIDRYGQITERPIGPETLNRIVADHARRAGLEGPYSGHSLRRGYATAARRAGKSLEEIQRHMAHKDAKSTVRYIDAVAVESSTATKGVGL